jgi:hypothetical protein
MLTCIHHGTSHTPGEKFKENGGKGKIAFGAKAELRSALQDLAADRERTLSAKRRGVRARQRRFRSRADSGCFQRCIRAGHPLVWPGRNVKKMKFSKQSLKEQMQ